MVTDRAVQGSAGQCRAVQGSAGQCRAVQGSAGQCSAVLLSRKGNADRPLNPLGVFLCSVGSWNHLSSRSETCWFPHPHFT